MQTSLYVSLSSQLALERRMTTLAGNVANINTAGYRATEIKFNEVLRQTGPIKTSYVDQGQDFLSTANGATTQTNNVFDFAIKGDAWFKVEGPSGEMLTRDGRFTMGEQGELLTITGYPVLDAGGGPIQLNPNASGPVAAADGTLSQDGVRVASIGLFTADLSAGFQRLSNLGIITASPPEPLVDQFDVRIAQGYVEESNVNAVAEMTRLIAISRSFENTTSMVKSVERTFKDAIQTLGGGR